MVYYLSMSEKTQPLSADFLVNSFDFSDKLRIKRGVGMEFEFLGVDSESGESIPFLSETNPEQSVSAVFEALANEEGYDPVAVDGHLMELKGHGHRLTLEPGAQLEISGDVHGMLEAVEYERTGFISRLLRVSEPRNIKWLTLGLTPFTPLEDIPFIPKIRYKYMSERFSQTGKLGHRMMKQTAGLQIAIDYDGLDDAADKYAAALNFSSFMTALFANSPLCGGRPASAQSFRALTWLDCDPSRCGFLEKTQSLDFAVRDYVDWILDAPMLFIIRDGNWIPVDAKNSFRDFLEKGIAEYSATFDDWNLHANVMFPEVRLREGYIEIRCMDSVPPALAMGALAFWEGILCIPEIRKTVREIAVFPDMASRLEFHHACAVSGLDAAFQGGKVIDVLQQVFTRVRENWKLERPKDLHFLETVYHLLYNEKRSPGAILLDHWEGDWGQDRERLIENTALHEHSP